MRSLPSIWQITRSGEWLTWKIPVFLTAALVVIHSVGKPVDLELGWHLGRVVLGLIIGAVFVSVLNDFTDLDDDRMAGKANRLESLTPQVRWLVLLLSILLVAAFTILVEEEGMSRLWYMAACLSFVVYSVPPFRVKKKGAWGGLGDALGASLFPMLYVAHDTASVLGTELSAGQSGYMLVWALAHGFRGILWHQYRDQAFDASIGSRTFATEHRFRTMKRIEPLIVAVEMGAFLMFAGYDLLPLMLVMLSIHLFVVILSFILLDVRHVMVVSPKDREQYMLYGTFYQTLCPVALLFSLCGWTPAFFLLSFVPVLIALPDLRINYYLLKRMVYENPVVRGWIRKRDGMNYQKRS